MKRFIAALSMVLLLAVTTQAHAFDSPLTDPKDRAALENVAKLMKGFAEDLGCSQFSWGNITSMGAVYQMQFIPTGTDAKNWKTRVQITVYGLPGTATDNRADTRMMMSLIASTTTSYRRAGVKMLQEATYTDIHGEPLLFMEYETGDNAYAQTLSKEHGAGVLKRTSKNAASFILLQSRGEKISPNQVLNIHRMVNPKAK